MRKHYYCTSCLKLNIKRLVLPIIISGFVTFMLFMSLTLNDYFQSFHILTDKSQKLQSFDMPQTIKEAQQAEEKDQTSQDTFPYKFLINEPNKCQKSNPFLVLLISVQAWQTEARQAIRKTWGDEDFLPGVIILRLFLLGKENTTNNDIQQKLAAESQQHHDIIQQDYLDTYNNLTLKTLTGLQWVAKYCPQASYIIKTDSDMFINTEYLVNAILRPDQPPKKDYFTGYLMRGYLPNRNKESKWYMPPELYPGDRYPVFCSGTGYVLSSDLADKIVHISSNIRVLHLEDVFIGTCLEKLGISPVPPPKDSDFNHWRVSYSPCIYKNLVTSHQFQPHELINYWNDLQKRKHTC